MQDPVEEKKEMVDTIFINGRVYTVEKQQPWAQAVVLSKGKIIYVGNNKSAQAYKGSKTNIIDLKGKMMLPGFIDSHLHASDTANYLFGVNLREAQSLEDYVQKVAIYYEQHQGITSIQGNGWSNIFFPPTGPNKETLDAVVKDIPVALRSGDFHSLWVNSKALELAGITKDTPNPSGGIIERNETGEPSGTLRETAQNLVLSKLSSFSIQQYKESLQYFQEYANTNGYTQVNHILVEAQENIIQALTALEKEDALSIRHNLSLTVQPNEGERRIPYLKEQRQTLQGPWVKLNGAKIFMDGVIEGGTAYLHEPYHNKPDYRGVPIWEKEAYVNIIRALDKEKFQIHIHSIGDAATTETLDALEYAQKTNGRRDSRHKITHLQLVKESDFIRFKTLGVLGIPQPSWFGKGPYFDQAVELLGEKRANKQYPMKSFIDKGVIMAASSDYPVTTGFAFSPLTAIQIGMSRSYTGTTNPTDVLNPKERVSLKDMIESYTINGAYANFSEHETGSIKVGKKADLVVLDKNLFEVSEDSIYKSKILLTILEGKEVYRHKDF
ncbi:amidohydrolase [Bacillus toyonensis]|uniref:amidohydrolase n=1 Tax=Bacillus toyonensis TaxID=155322 RepID=UPI000BF13D93|nr:amidohydrolase [Bacillus toyonensis]PEM43682.1 amidohydrolase [Bacillus toyonensis]PHE86323.1 amidohydrolase [Bacillus toyonensis]